MNIFIILGLVIIFVISFYLAFKSLKELEVPKEVLAEIKKGKPAPKFWGIIIFLQGKTLHFSSGASVSGNDESSSSNSSNISERIDV